MGYGRGMGFLLIFTGTNSVDPENLWGIAEYGLSGIWVMAESTVTIIVMV